ncbi:tripartite tricarboxylate transporter TctB family protein [Microbaculum marinum]|uniref:Tripartite tricarboxylate transporter TctB family protein n=1 Tax=Microbaculum marinum TaxID=1764581 RepID=A0AAW9RCR9_9HYPH
MKVNDAISGLLFVLLAGAIYYVTRNFPIMPGQDYGAAFFPRTIATFMAILGALLMIRGIREREAGPVAEPFEWMRSPGLVANFLLVVGALIFYIAVSDRLGFVITAFITLYALLFWLRGRRFWLSSLAISVVSVIVLQQFFGQFLRVPLPWGVLEAYAW